jgi:phosphopantetheinyl transferase
MPETSKTAAPLERGNTNIIGIYLVRDAALNVRNCLDPDNDAGAREYRAGHGDTLLRLGLAHLTGTALLDWQIGRSAAGGPIIQQSQVTQNHLHLSLSHSGNYLVAGICNAAPIGVDIERHRNRRFTEIAEHLEWPGVVRDPPGSLQADGFYHLWTLWEAAIKACSTEPATLAAAVFNSIMSGLAAGTPNARSTQDWFARSWQCPGNFWLSVIAGCPVAPDIRLFLVDGLESANRTTQIGEIANEDGVLNPQIFHHEPSETI